MVCLLLILVVVILVVLLAVSYFVLRNAQLSSCSLLCTLEMHCWRKRADRNLTDSFVTDTDRQLCGIRVARACYSLCSLDLFPAPPIRCHPIYDIYLA